jgi:hypothetical protein
MEPADSGASDAYVAALRRMSPAQKLEAVAELYWTARRLKAAGLRRQHPEWTEAQVETALRDAFLHARD